MNRLQIVLTVGLLEDHKLHVFDNVANASIGVFGIAKHFIHDIVCGKLATVECTQRMRDMILYIAAVNPNLLSFQGHTNLIGYENLNKCKVGFSF